MVALAKLKFSYEKTDFTSTELVGPHLNHCDPLETALTPTDTRIIHRMAGSTDHGLRVLVPADGEYKVPSVE